MEFSKIVRKVRKQLRMSQQQLADALCVSFATINRWENGHVIPSNLAQKSFLIFVKIISIEIYAKLLYLANFHDLLPQ
jgi:putative transcriptional regulator